MCPFTGKMYITLRHKMLLTIAWLGVKTVEQLPQLRLDMRRSEVSHSGGDREETGVRNRKMTECYQQILSCVGFVK